MRFLRGGDALHVGGFAPHVGGDPPPPHCARKCTSIAKRAAWLAPRWPGDAFLVEGCRMWGAKPPTPPNHFARPPTLFAAASGNGGAEGRTAFAGGTLPPFFGITWQPLHERRIAFVGGKEGRGGEASPQRGGERGLGDPFCCGLGQRSAERRVALLGWGFWWWGGEGRASLARGDEGLVEGVALQRAILFIASRGFRLLFLWLGGKRRFFLTLLQVCGMVSADGRIGANLPTHARSKAAGDFNHKGEHHVCSKTNDIVSHDFP